MAEDTEFVNDVRIKLPYEKLASAVKKELCMFRKNYSTGKTYNNYLCP